MKKYIYLGYVNMHSQSRSKKSSIFCTASAISPRPLPLPQNFKFKIRSPRLHCTTLLCLDCLALLCERCMEDILLPIVFDYFLYQVYDIKMAWNFLTKGMKYYKEKAKELTDRCNQIIIYAHNTHLKKAEEKISYVNALMEKQI